MFKLLKTLKKRECLLDICNQCGLKHFIGTLPNGLDTVLNDTVTISAGQKQLCDCAPSVHHSRCGQN